MWGWEVAVVVALVQLVEPHLLVMVQVVETEAHHPYLVHLLLTLVVVVAEVLTLPIREVLEVLEAVEQVELPLALELREL